MKTIFDHDSVENQIAELMGTLSIRQKRYVRGLIKELTQRVESQRGDLAVMVYMFLGKQLHDEMRADPARFQQAVLDVQRTARKDRENARHH